MFFEAMIFAAFFAVAFVAHLVHAFVAKERLNAERAHRFAVAMAVLAKAAQVALHDYALHAAEMLVHALAH